MIQKYCKNGVLKNFVKFTGKHMCWSLFFNKLAGLRPATSSERDDIAGELFKNNFLKNISGGCF